MSSKALKFLEESQSIKEKMLAPHDGKIGKGAANLASIYLNLKNDDKACRYYK